MSADAEPDLNQALIDITRQPAFVAIQQPLVDYKNRCGMQVSPTDALTVLAEVQASAPRLHAAQLRRHRISGRHQSPCAFGDFGIGQ